MEVRLLAEKKYAILVTTGADFDSSHLEIDVADCYTR